MQRQDKSSPRPPLRLDEIAPPLEGDIPATALTGYRQLVKNLGGDGDALLGRVGIRRVTLADPNGRLSLNGVAKLLEITAEALNCQDFGMRLAGMQSGTQIVRPLARLYHTAPSYGDALLCSIYHGQAYTSAIQASLTYLPEQNSYAQGCRFVSSDGIPTHVQLVELTLLLAQNAAIELSGGRLRAREIWITHPRISPIAVYRRHFQAAVRFGKEGNALIFDESAIQAKLIDSNEPEFRRELERVAALYPTRVDDFRSKVAATIRPIMRECPAHRAEVAERLAISVRTLNRRLHDLGTSFGSVREDVIRNRAISYLLCTDLSITEISGLLTFSEAAVFSRSCKRWFGLSPSCLRRRFANRSLS